jgi:predicted ribosomally synthesized peptide with SipW-like signal peptide
MIVRTFFIAAFALAVSSASAWAAWTAREEIKSYSVTGRTGPELYASIGENGPKLGAGRVIAHTSFKLTWRRDYQRRGKDCVLASAKPNLVITYTLPKARERLASPTAENWARFRTGVEAHERVHGQIIREMVGEILAISVGLVEKDDPGCKKIRVTLTDRLREISGRERARQRGYDQVEFSDGGAVHQLILMLVNGG